MDTFKRLPRAASEPLPALADFLQPFHSPFGRRESQAALERYLTGLVTDHPRKNCDTLAAIIPDTSEQQLQGLLTTLQWNADALNQQRVERMLTLPTSGAGVLIFDDTGLLKQGQSSVGVARHYTGTLDKVTNGQVAVTCVYAERTVAWPVAARLYLPAAWCAEAARRAKAHIPDAVQFQTKPEIALALLDQARKSGVPHACMTADADYGEWRIGWLIGERPLPGTRGDRAYYWSNFPASTPLEVLVEYTHRRHQVERFHQDAKDLLGWDQYQGRLWHGFHRQAALVLLSYSFLVWQERQQRQAQPRGRGRARGAFSPSAGSPPLLARNDSSAGLRGTAVSSNRRTYPRQAYRSVSAATELTPVV